MTILPLSEDDFIEVNWMVKIIIGTLGLKSVFVAILKYHKNLI